MVEALRIRPPRSWFAVGRRWECRKAVSRPARVVDAGHTHMQMDWLRPFVGHEWRQQAVRELRVAALSNSGAGR